VWTGLSRAAGSNQARAPCPCRGSWAERQTARGAPHTCADSYSYECRSTGQDCPSRPASADQPDAPSLTDPPPGLGLRSRQSSSSGNVWSAVVVNTAGVRSWHGTHACARARCTAWSAALVRRMKPTGVLIYRVFQFGATFTCHAYPKYFLFHPSHWIFRRLYKVLNIGKKIINCIVCL
jgi:hypothetical protein